MQLFSLLDITHLLPLSAERFEPLIEKNGLTIERIISTGQVSPPDFWYDQSRHEFVVLLQGEAKLALLSSSNNHVEEIHLRAGEGLNLPVGLRHRVTYTTSDPPCIWLAIHYD